MKTQNTTYAPGYRKLNRMLLTGGILSGILTGWLLGSFTTQAFSQSGKPANKADSTVLFSIPVNGEVLPTVMLDEFAVVAAETIK